MKQTTRSKTSTKLRVFTLFLANILAQNRNVRLTKIQGQRGPIGPKGAKGVEGPHGAQGVHGQQGEDGRMGPAGYPGPPGPPGPKGQRAPFHPNDQGSANQGSANQRTPIPTIVSDQVPSFNYDYKYILQRYGVSYSLNFRL